ncbi:glycoside hydrolase family 25 protein [Corynebacterium xerosis]|uniref:glycoside hydrolase family 25 protein n=1 Tax=Corynebacterium xerosis TaxID=1725 RepID=UPI001E4237AA|nr:glycoside hydrolase family 25 protein [Corynebacterium xerosis]
MNLRTVTFPNSRPRSGARRGRAGAIVALAAALPMALGVLAPAPAEAFTVTSPTGIDVSKWQRPGGVKLDWNKVAASGEKFAFIKATDGKEGLSPFFAEDSKAAHDAGLIIGSYHKAHPDRDAVVQADAYAQALKLQPANAKTLPPVLDLELDAGMTPAALEKWAATFLERLELKSGKMPMIYTYRWFWVTKMGDTDGLNGYPLWLAAYQDQPPTDVPGGWNEPLFWQRSSTGVVPGINTPVDLNTFNGTKAQLEGLSKGGSANGVNGRGAGDATASPETRGEPKSEAEAAGAQRAQAEDDTDVSADAVSPPTGRAAIGAGSLGDDAATGGTGNGTGTGTGNGANTGGTGNDAATGDDAPETIGGDTTAPESPLATAELVDAIIEAIRGGSSDADFDDSIAAVRDAAEAAGLDAAQIDTLIAFLKQAIESGNVPEGQLEEIGENAPTADEASQADKAGDTIGGDDAAAGEGSSFDPDQAIKLATYSDLVALLAGASR